MTKQKRTHKTAKVLLSLAVAGALVGSVFAGCSAGKVTRETRTPPPALSAALPLYPERKAPAPGAPL